MKREESVPRHSGASVKSQVDTSLVVIALGFLCNISMTPALEFSGSQPTECRILTNKLVLLNTFFVCGELIVKCQTFKQYSVGVHHCAPQLGSCYAISSMTSHKKLRLAELRGQ